MTQADPPRAHSDLAFEPEVGGSSGTMTVLNEDSVPESISEDLVPDLRDELQTIEATYKCPSFFARVKDRIKQWRSVM